MIHDGAVRCDGLHQRAEVRLVEIPLDLRDRGIDPFRAGTAADTDVAEEGAHLLRRDDRDHQRRHALHRPGLRVHLRRHHPRREAVVKVGIE
ncbi:MAG: hypothetical protein ACK559_37825, partial [bacterium]